MRLSVKTLIICFIALVAILLACETDPLPDINIPEPIDSSSHIPTAYELDLNLKIGMFTSPVNNPMTIEGVELGRHLFYEKRLSVSKEVSCGTCHKQAFAFGDDLSFSIDAIGRTTRRHTPTLMNLGWRKRFFWDGRVTTIEDATMDALTNEQHVDWQTTVIDLENDAYYGEQFAKAFPNREISQERVAMAISQFLRTLVSSGNSKFDAVLRTNDTTLFTPSENRGFNLYNSEKGDCFHCHEGVLLQPINPSDSYRNNGLNCDYSDDEGLAEHVPSPLNIGKFLVPSLRNIIYSAPYMHDARFNTLEEVIEFYNEDVKIHPNIDVNMTDPQGFNCQLPAACDTCGVKLTEAEQIDLINFIKTATDDDFITNPDFSDPF